MFNIDIDAFIVFYKQLEDSTKLTNSKNTSKPKLTKKVYNDFFKKENENFNKISINNSNNKNKQDLINKIKSLLYLLGLIDGSHIGYIFTKLFSQIKTFSVIGDNSFLYNNDDDIFFIRLCDLVNKQLNNNTNEMTRTNIGKYIEFIDKTNKDDYSYVFIEIDKDKI